MLSWLESAFDGLLDEVGRGPDAVRGVGVGLPGPVEFATGQPVNPPIMPGWDRYPVGDRLARRYAVPALVDNDVNIMAVGEHWSNWRDEAFLLFVKIGTGIGSGIVPVATCTVAPTVRPATSATSTCPATTTSSAAAATAVAWRRSRAVVRWRCGCASRACPRRPAATWSTRVRAGRPEAVQLIREAGRTVGGVLATCVNMLNPAVIVIGGTSPGPTSC